VSGDDESVLDTETVSVALAANEARGEVMLMEPDGADEAVTAC